jgi:hypothetical protein
MKKLIKSINKFFKDVWMGITIANEYQNKSQWPKS